MSPPGGPRSSGPPDAGAHHRDSLSLWAGGWAFGPPGSHESAQSRAGVEVTTWCTLCPSFSLSPAQPGTDGLSETL